MGGPCTCHNADTHAPHSARGYGLGRTTGREKRTSRKNHSGDCGEYRRNPSLRGRADKGGIGGRCSRGRSDEDSFKRAASGIGSSCNPSCLTLGPAGPAGGSDEGGCANRGGDRTGVLLRTADFGCSKERGRSGKLACATD